MLLESELLDELSSDELESLDSDLFYKELLISDEHLLIDIALLLLFSSFDTLLISDF